MSYWKCMKAHRRSSLKAALPPASSCNDDEEQLMEEIYPFLCDINGINRWNISTRTIHSATEATLARCFHVIATLNEQNSEAPPPLIYSLTSPQTRCVHCHWLTLCLFAPNLLDGLEHNAAGGWMWPKKVLIGHEEETSDRSEEVYVLWVCDNYFMLLRFRDVSMKN